MQEVQQVSEAELDIMKIIWGKVGSALYADIMEQLQLQGRTWKKNTVITLLSRLVDKKMLKTNKLGRKNEYRALVTEENYQMNQIKMFVDKVYEGDVTSLVSTLIQNNMISANEYEELKRFWEGEKHE